MSSNNTSTPAGGGGVGRSSSSSNNKKKRRSAPSSASLQLSAAPGGSGGGTGEPLPPLSHQQQRRGGNENSHPAASPGQRQQQRHQQLQQQQQRFPSSSTRRQQGRRRTSRGGQGGGHAPPPPFPSLDIQRSPGGGRGGTAGRRAASAASSSAAAAAASAGAPAGATAAERSPNNELIWKLSQCCQHHYEKCHSGKNAGGRQQQHHQSGGGASSSAERIPQACRKALVSMGKVLRIVEIEEDELQLRQRRPSDSGGGNSGGSTRHLLCEFYKNVCAGNFCPHGPHLFRVLSCSGGGEGGCDDEGGTAGGSSAGKAMHQVLSRVHSILKHLVVSSPYVAADATATAAGASGAGGADHESIDTTFVETTSRLVQVALSLVGHNPAHQSLLLNDLVSLAMDTCVLTEAAARASETAPPPTCLDLWPSLRGSDVLVGGEKTPHSGSYELVLSSAPVRLKRQLAVLQMTVVGVLQRVLDRIVRQRRNAMLFGIEEQQELCGNGSSNNFDWGTSLADPPIQLGASRSQLLLAVVRHTLLSRRSRVRNNMGTAPADIGVLRSKLYAIRLLSLIYDDQLDHCGMPFFGFRELTTPLALIVARAAKQCLKWQQEESSSHAKDDSNSATALKVSYAQYLTKLMTQLLCLEPSENRPPFSRDVSTSPRRSVQLAVLRDLWNTVPYVSLLSTLANQPGDPVLRLASIVVRGLWSALHETTAASASSAATVGSLASSSFQVQHLVQLLGNHDLCFPAAGIMIILLQSNSNIAGGSLRSESSLYNLRQVYSHLCGMREALNLEEHAAASKNGGTDSRKRSSGASTSVAASKTNVLRKDTNEDRAAKRLRTALPMDEQETHDFLEDPSTSSSSLEESLACFLVRSSAAATNLMGRSPAGTASAAAFDSMLSDVTYASSAFQILVALLLTSDGQEKDSLRDLATCLIDSLLVTLQSALPKLAMEDGFSACNSYVLCTIIACGSFAFKLTRLERASDHQGLAERMHSLVEAAKHGYCLFTDKMKQQMSAGTCRDGIVPNDIILYLSMLNNNGASPSCFELFPGVVVSPTIGSSARHDHDTLLDCDFFLRRGIERDEEAQRVRLGFLQKAMENGEPFTGTSLRNDTFHVVAARLDYDDPQIRLVQWQSLAWLCLVASPVELRHLIRERAATGVGDFGRNLAAWFLAIAFADPCSRVRDYASREIGCALLQNQGDTVIAFLATDDEWNCVCTNDFDSEERTTASGRVVSRLFQTVDHLLKENCSFSQSQLSLTGGTARRDGLGSDELIDTILGFQKSAARSLVSICNLQISHQDQARMLFEESLKRVFCISNGPPTTERFERSGICVGELFVLRDQVDFGYVFREHCLSTLAPTLFRALLVPTTGVTVDASRGDIDACSLGHRESQYLLLYDIIKRFLKEDSHTHRLPVESINVSDVGRFIELSLPSAVSQFIVEEDYDVLKLCTGFKLYVLNKNRAGQKLLVRSGNRKVPADIIIGTPRVSENRRSQHTKPWSINLEDETRKLCSGKSFPDLILPLIFMYAGRSQLTFFSRTVLQSLHPLKQIMEKRGQLILKQLVKELGRTRESSRALRAIKAAALARTDDPTAVSMTTNSSQSGANASNAAGHEAATEWVTSQFMYLLVNCIQSKWSSKSASDRVNSLRCLFAMLGFLRPKESAQYLPQILSTVNVSIDENVEKFDAQQDQRCELRFRAVQVLDNFLKLVAKHHWEPLAQNLTNIVVSLIPVISACGEISRQSERVYYYLRKSKDLAVALLEWLTKDELGTHLAPFFQEIPFLPASPALASVRSSLQGFGVDFDRLQVVPSQISQHESMDLGDGIASDLSTSTQGKAQNARRHFALRKRLGMICLLLGNENASIRRVALQHLTSLLRANRELFHSLVDNEGSTSIKRYLTVPIEDRGLSRGTVTEMVQTLLKRCVKETDPDTRVLLAECFGEVGAIDNLRLEEAERPISQGSGSLDEWMLAHPPWRCHRNEYEYRIVTKHLVGALKAAPTSSEQHKVAFSIQQILVLLNRSYSENTTCTEMVNNNTASSTPSMNESLKKKLCEADVFDVVEPFWFSQFKEVGGISIRQSQPPFFENSTDYNQWMTCWCSHMIHRSKDGSNSIWRELFYACRTVVRTPAGLGVAEFLLPLLILDRLCFGNAKDERIILQEIQDALSFEGAFIAAQMDWTDKQKAVSIVFGVIETLESWAETQIERQYEQKKKRRMQEDTSESDWPLEDAVMRIEDFSKAIPLPLRARAAAKIGMNARALRQLEMSSRKTIVKLIFDSVETTDGTWKRSLSRAAGICPHSEVILMKDVLAALHDYETVSSLDGFKHLSDPKSCTRDTIRQKEAAGDWEGALQGYERAQQLSGPDQKDPQLQCGALRCLLELGHFDSALNQVTGIMKSNSVTCADPSFNCENTVALGTEAAWRLGRWDALSHLVSGLKENLEDPEYQYQVSVSRLMLGIKKKDQEVVSLELKNARSAIMAGLSSSARESYSRAYDQIVRLQALSEIEDAAALLCFEDRASLADYVSSLGWDRRLDFLSTTGASTIIKTRLALSRLAGDSSYEGSLFVDLGRRARKKGLHNIAANSFAQAEAVFVSVPTAKTGMEMSSLQMQVAKLKHDTGESSAALRMLGLDNIETLKHENLRAEAKRYVQEVLQECGSGIDEDRMVEIFVRRALQSTRWMVDGSLKDVSEIKGRFLVIHELAPKWEKGHFQYAKYVDSLLESRILALQRRTPEQSLGADEEAIRCRSIKYDIICQDHLIAAMKHYAEALSIETKHIFQALPRLLSLWFDLTSIQIDADKHAGRESELGRALDHLKKRQDEANTLMALQVKQIPAHAYYTVIPQLIARVIHDDRDTAMIVRSILKRVLIKFPGQAMWALGWLRFSRDAERKKAGEGIFKDAIRTLQENPNQQHYKLLITSKSLFQWLQKLAKYRIKDLRMERVTFAPWKGEVQLSEFIPPIQAALSVSMSTGDTGRVRDVFPRQVPRMIQFSSKVELMSSKARPKKLKAYVVTSDACGRSEQQVSRKDVIGELHFLVKQEARGDLRKDARVQDLNNVINRLSSSTSHHRGRNRGGDRNCLHLRTFCVTCLSEDSGIMEWVPDTAALRKLITNTYNPQAAQVSLKRRGDRVTSVDQYQKTSFERCQSMYFDNGDLKRAAASYEDVCIKPNPPLFFWWFVQHFRDPHSWYEARTRFTLSAAAWSAVGHVIGLGDRHSENILLDMASGACVHVDFDCIFDKGLQLPKPEVVPFRLTQNMLDAFGPTGADGVYSQSLQAALETLRNNRDTLLSVLEPFIKDPVIDWKRQKSSQRDSSNSGGNSAKQQQELQTKEARRSIKVIDERLLGCWNLQNPNHRRVRRTDGSLCDPYQHDATHYVRLSVEGQAHKLIAEATSAENQVQMFVGWMPWL